MKSNTELRVGTGRGRDCVGHCVSSSNRPADFSATKHDVVAARKDRSEEDYGESIE